MVAVCFNFLQTNPILSRKIPFDLVASHPLYARFAGFLPATLEACLPGRFMARDNVRVVVQMRAVFLPLAPFFWRRKRGRRQ